MIELTDEAIKRLIEKTKDGNDTIRIGVTGGGCAGFEYVMTMCMTTENSTLSSTIYHCPILQTPR